MAYIGEIFTRRFQVQGRASSGLAHFESHLSAVETVGFLLFPSPEEGDKTLASSSDMGPP